MNQIQTWEGASCEVASCSIIYYTIYVITIQKFQKCLFYHVEILYILRNLPNAYKNIISYFYCTTKVSTINILIFFCMISIILYKNIIYLFFVLKIFRIHYLPYCLEVISLKPLMTITC